MHPSILWPSHPLYRSEPNPPKRLNLLRIYKIPVIKARHRQQVNDTWSEFKLPLMETKVGFSVSPLLYPLVSTSVFLCVLSPPKKKQPTNTNMRIYIYVCKISLPLELFGLLLFPSLYVLSNWIQYRWQLHRWFVKYCTSLTMSNTWKWSQSRRRWRWRRSISS